MEEPSKAAESLDTRLLAAASAHGLDLNKLAGRILVESVLRHWPRGMGPDPVLLTGELLFDQTLRETQDAGVMIFRYYRPDEILRGMEIIAPILLREGIRLDLASQAPQAIDGGYGAPIDRWTIRGMVGAVSAASNIDMALGAGPDAISEAIEISEIPSVIADFPPLDIACQPLEAVAAEKLLAVVLQADTDFRIGHLADLINARLWHDVDCRDVARELSRLCRHHRIDIEELPKTLEWPTIQRLESTWEHYRAVGKTELSIFSAWIDAAYLWGEVRDELGLERRPFAVQRPVSNIVRFPA
ncbi:hypothetical protein [Shinella sp.]|uniref:hypothetical protein n=1 Tax=Shinella sp. TaxID=1870904 RepID=UPI00258A695B|nr:hypothetical protein [Shinella sp.]MCW5711568.1 hypothetical protein [Shinella sp.]